MGWLAGWSYAKEISLTGQTGAGTLYQVDLDIGASAGGDFHLEGHCTNFPQDIEVTDDDGTTLLDFFIEDLTADPLKLWVEVADDLGSNQKIWVYYGKSGATTNSSISSAFIVGDDGETGSPSGSWVVQDTASIVIESTVVKYGSYALKVDTGANVQSAMHLAFSNRSSGILEYYMRVPSNAASISGRFDDGIFADDKGTNFFYRDTINKFQYYDTGYHDVQAASINTWYRVKLVVKSLTQYDIYIDGVLKNSNATTRNSPTNYDRINVGGYHTNGIVYIDNLFVRKYNATEPAFASAGAEQSAPVAGHPTMKRWGGIPGMQYTGRRSW